MKVKQLFYKLIENWPAKAVCFVMALFLYVFNQQSGLTSKTIRTRLSLEPQSGFLPAEAYDRDISVTIRGKSEEIASLTDKDFTAYIDFSYVSVAGKYEFPVLLKLEQSVTSLNPMEIKVTPEKIVLKVEEEIAGFADVSPLLKGEVAHGYYVKSVTCNPEQIKITGASSQVEGYKKVQTGSVALSNASKSFTTAVRIENRKKNIILEKKSVDVTVEVEERKDVKTFSNVPVTAMNLHPGLELKGKLAPVCLTVDGALLDIEKIVDVSLICRADCSEITDAGEYDVRLRYFIPGSLHLDESYVKSVHVDVAVKKDVSEEKVIISENFADILEEKVEPVKTE